VFGGNSAGEVYNDVWLLSNANGTGGTPTWTQLLPSGTLPVARANNSTTYDPTTNSITIFGGEQISQQPLGDTWALSNANGLAGTPAWTQLSPSLYFPAARDFHTGVYDPSTNNLTIFGGGIITSEAPATFLNDVWILSQANGQ
jgi:hypothetical protein